MASARATFTAAATATRPLWHWSRTGGAFSGLHACGVGIHEESTAFRALFSMHFVIRRLKNRQKAKPSEESISTDEGISIQLTDPHVIHFAIGIIKCNL
jgi:hypothetical protein